MEEWLSRFLFRKKAKGVTPKDNIEYVIPKGIITYTEGILKEYGSRTPAAEGVVYWAGKNDGDRYIITSAIAPETVASRHDILTTHESNAKFVEFICDNGLIYIAQVHSHPSTWVDHSDVDNEETAFRSEGLVSIVVPNFSKAGMLPLKSCGIHRYMNNSFSRLSNKYIKLQFQVAEQDYKLIFKDFRNGR